MKIEIDLNDILGDEYGAESLQDSIRRQVIDSVTNTINKGVGAKIDATVSETISKGIAQYLTVEMPALVANIMDAEYTPVGRYGDREQTTTFRKQLVKSITENMVYKRTQYQSDANVFTKAVDSVVSENITAFKADFDKLVNANFTAEAMAYAAAQLKKKLGISQ